LPKNFQPSALCVGGFSCAQCRHSPKPALSRRRAARIELERNQMMKLARKQGMSKTDAQAWVYSELDRMYPPLTIRQKADIVLSDSEVQNSEEGSGDNEKRTVSGAQRPVFG
jgi:hypothetical protein